MDQDFEREYISSRALCKMSNMGGIIKVKDDNGIEDKITVEYDYGSDGGGWHLVVFLKIFLCFEEVMFRILLKSAKFKGIKNPLKDLLPFVVVAEVYDDY